MCSERNSQHTSSFSKTALAPRREHYFYILPCPHSSPFPRPRKTAQHTIITLLFSKPALSPRRECNFLVSSFLVSIGSRGPSKIVLRRLWYVLRTPFSTQLFLILKNCTGASTKALPLYSSLPIFIFIFPPLKKVRRGRLSARFVSKPAHSPRRESLLFIFCWLRHSRAYVRISSVAFFSKIPLLPPLGLFGLTRSHDQPP